MISWTIVADDLTGAADAAASYGRTHSSAVVLDVDSSWPDKEILVVNTESRYVSEDQAAAKVSYTVRRSVAMGRNVFKKIDSLLRGNVGVEIAAGLSEIARNGRGLALVAPAFPATGRTTVGGVVHVNGVANTGGPFGGNIAQALVPGGLKVGSVINAVDRTPEEIAQNIGEMQQQGVRVVVLDAVCDADLENIVRAADLVDVPTFLVGSGGLASHIASRQENVGVRHTSYPGVSRALVVIGSYSALATSQRQALVDAGVRHITLDHADLFAPTVHGDLARAIADGDVVLTPDPAVEMDKANAHLVARALAAAAVAVIDICDALVLIGGETARAVMDALGVNNMTVLGEFEPGVVVSKLPANMPLVVTKAGAFGDAGTLVRTIGSLKTTEMSIK